MTAAHCLDGVDLDALVRRYEPVVRFTKGELFFPMSVESYVRRSALWSRATASAEPSLLVDHGALDLDILVAHARELNSARLELRYVPGALDRAALRQWRRRPDRVRFASTSRFAAVGLLGRLIDSLFRLSLIVRGGVPGGLTAAAHRQYSAADDAREPHYFAHVTSDGDYVAIQYWFFYAMNDWRSTFGGVNDHEADWEQVTVYLVTQDESVAATEGDDPTRRVRLAWVAFSSHDEVGDDLRRRVDDPDITWVDGTHAVVSAGAGSHSGAHLTGEYLVRVAPPVLQRTARALRAVRDVLLPFKRNAPSSGLGIPYIDYKRGDGVAIGPGTGLDWHRVLIDDSTPWVTQFRGLWGLDTDDPFGGERAPAGPRYERNGTIRPCWSDPVGWAGLDKVPGTERGQLAVLAARRTELMAAEATLATQIEQERATLAELAAGTAALPVTVAAARRVGTAARARVVGQEDRVEELRASRRAVRVERESVELALRQPSGPVPPHSHLRHRALPDVDPDRAPGRLLRFWTEISLSVLLGLLGVALLFDYGSAWRALFVAILVVMAIEALLRKRLVRFLLGAVLLVGVVALTLLLLRNLRAGVGVLALVAAGALLVANLRAMLSRR